MHDDQHGTAIISCAALLNALELSEKKDRMRSRIVISGAGAAAVSPVPALYQAFGAKKENIVMLDSKGVIGSTRSNLSSQKAEFATDRRLILWKRP